MYSLYIQIDTNGPIQMASESRDARRSKVCTGYFIRIFIFDDNALNGATADEQAENQNMKIEKQRSDQRAHHPVHDTTVHARYATLTSTNSSASDSDARVNGSGASTQITLYRKQVLDIYIHIYICSYL